MPRIHKWVGKRVTSWWFDIRDAGGKKRRITRRSKEEAKQELAKWTLDRSAADPHKPFSYWAHQWLEDAKMKVESGDLKRQSYRSYEANVRIHILPEIGSVKLSQLSRHRIYMMLREKRAGGLKGKTTGHILSTVYGICGYALEHGAIKSNPAQGLAKKLGLARISKRLRPKAFRRPEVKKLLGIAEKKHPFLYPLLLVMYQCGLRVSEAIALMWHDILWQEGLIHVARSKTEEGYSAPKSGRDRKVDMSEQLAGRLADHFKWICEQKLARGWRDKPAICFVKENGQPYTRQQVAAEFKEILREAGLALHYTPHSLRHSYATLQLEAGTNPVYVQRQLGHGSIQMTVDLYGRDAVIRDREAASKLDDSGTKNISDFQAMVEKFQNRNSQ